MAYQLVTGQQLRPGAVLRAGRAARAGRATPPTTRSASLVLLVAARRWPTACRSARSAAARSSRRCSSARRSASRVSGLPGMELGAAIGMGIGAMCCAMLRLPLTSALLATLLLGADGLRSPRRSSSPWSWRSSSLRCFRRPARRGSQPDDRATRAPQRDRRLALHGRVGVLRGRLGAGLPQRRRWVGRRRHVRRRSVFFTERLLRPARPGADPGDDRRRHGDAAPTAPVRLSGGLPARPRLAGRGHPVPGHAVLQHQHHRRPGRTTRRPPQSDRHVWRPDIYGSVLFLVSSALAVLAVSHRFFSRPAAVAALADRLAQHGSARCSSWRRRSPATSSRAPTRCSTSRLAVAGTFFGAVCFLVGAALMLPAWRRPS